MKLKTRKSIYKNLINNVLAPLGLELRRRRPRQLWTGKSQQLTANHIVEFLGPSGIGKSAVFKNSKECLKYPWSFRCDSDSFKSASCTAEILSIYQDLYWAKLQKVKEKSVNPINEIEVIVNIVKRVREDISMRCLSHAQGFFLQEGLFAYCASLARGLEEARLRKIISGRSFIIILPENTETAVDRFIQREELTGERPNYFYNLTENELYEAQDRAINVQYEFGCSVERVGCNVLWLKAEDDIETNAKKVVNFELRVVDESWQH